MNQEQLIRYAVDELMAQGNLAVLEEVFSIEYVAHAGNKQYQGHDFIKRWTKQMHSAIDDIRVVEILILSQVDNTISWQRTLTGKHIRSLRGIPASRKKVTWTEMVVSRFAEDKIAEEWVVSELAGALLLELPDNTK